MASYSLYHCPTSTRSNFTFPSKQHDTGDCFRLEVTFVIFQSQGIHLGQLGLVLLAVGLGAVVSAVDTVQELASMAFHIIIIKADLQDMLFSTELFFFFLFSESQLSE